MKKFLEELQKNQGITPGLAVVIVGDDPASHVYVKNKQPMAMQFIRGNYYTSLLRHNIILSVMRVTCYGACVLLSTNKTE